MTNLLIPATVLMLLGGCAASVGGAETASIDGTELQLFTFRPTGCAISGILIVFHGVDRNPATYRDDAIPLAQRYCRFVVAPLFDDARFPSWRYQRGGIVHDRAVLPRSQWTVSLVPDLAAWARQKLSQPDLPYALIGHSAGAQFLSRVAAYAPGNATRFVIANPSTWVRARADIAAPYGFADAVPPSDVETALRRYLALPLNILLGGDDTGSKNLSESEAAEEQGSTRLARGQTVYAEAEQTARQHGWPFNWRITVVPGVGHNARQIFSAPAAFDALRP